GGGQARRERRGGRERGGAAVAELDAGGGGGLAGGVRRGAIEGADLGVAAAGVLGVRHRRERERHVLRRDGLAVVPGEALAQREGEGPGVLRHLPALGHVGLERQRLRGADQPCEDEL